MRTLTALLFTLALVAPAWADDAPSKPAPQPKAENPKDAVEDVPAEKEKPKKLAVGDPAPPLTVTDWLSGDKVESFAEGKSYVVEFWATWCGPCIVMMPHLSDLQEQYRDEGLTVVGLSSKDANNGQEKVAKFVAKRKKHLKYTMAYADDRDTYAAYMTASGQRGIPCTFVVDEAGKIAYIGHPMYLGLVIPKVVAGTWTADDMASVDKAEADVQGMFKALSGADAEAGLAALAEFNTKYPELSDIPYFVAPSLRLMIKAEKFDQVKEFAEARIKKASEQGDASALNSLAGTLAGTDGAAADDLNTLALKAASKAVELDGTDPVVLYLSAKAHFAAGQKATARELGAKAIAAAADQPRIKTQLVKLVEQFEEKKEPAEKKDDEKSEKDSGDKE